MVFNAMEIFQGILLSTRFCRFRFRVQDIFHFHKEMLHVALFLYHFSKLGKPAILGKLFPIVSSAYCLGGVAKKFKTTIVQVSSVPSVMP